MNFQYIGIKIKLNWENKETLQGDLRLLENSYLISERYYCGRISREKVNYNDSQYH